MGKERYSNFELLRIVAMLGVMTLHACAVVDSNGLMFFFALVSVNVFILISGWFKIKLRLKGVLNFMFLIGFWTCINALWVIDQSPKIGLGELLLRLNPFRNWFIASYLMLMLLSPILNGFCVSGGVCRGGFLCVWFGVEMLVDCVLPLKIWGVFSGGYSVFHFIGIYLLGAFLRDYSAGRPKRFSRRAWFLSYIGITLASTLLYMLLTIISQQDGVVGQCATAIAHRLELYSSPLVILASVALFMIFAGSTIRSSFINHVASSMFAVFLAHCPGYYRQTIQSIGMQHVGLGEFVKIVGFIVTVFVGAVIVDQLRIAIWQGLCSLIAKVRQKLI